jgi:hypothetical protein
LLDRAEYLLANKGINQMRCFNREAANGGTLDNRFEKYGVIMDPSMLELESLARKAYYIIWYGPMVMDAFTLTKLFFDKYMFQSEWGKTGG